MPTIRELQEINDEVKDIIHTDFSITPTPTTYVPNFEDPGLTFETGQSKKAKTIETCVLYIDIRNSTDMSNKHRPETMGKLYTAFVKAMIYAAETHQGVIRNIIGDRVMVVFPEKDCYTNAVHCAITMHSIATNIINKHFKLNEFKCGIGIDNGKMLVLKTGIAKQGNERAPYKNLVWVGKPANIASKLTDKANKAIKFVRFKHQNYSFIDKEMEYEHFMAQIKLSQQAIYLENQPITTIQEFSKGTSPILMTHNVYENYKKLNPTCNSIINNHWTVQPISIKQYAGQIVGGDLHWTNIKNISI